VVGELFRFLVFVKGLGIVNHTLSHVLAEAVFNAKYAFQSDVDACFLFAFSNCGLMASFASVDTATWDPPSLITSLQDS
jgi:energy-converting hydrogenase Eha subunit H